MSSAASALHIGQPDRHTGTPGLNPSSSLAARKFHEKSLAFARRPADPQHTPRVWISSDWRDAMVVKSRSQSRKRVPDESTACVIIYAQHVHEIAAREFATY
jgi:hypothetical protein